MADVDSQLTYVIQQVMRAGGTPPERVQRWQRLLAGLRDGTLGVSAHTSDDAVPPWVTRDGAAAATLPAAGALHDHERMALTEVAKGSSGSERTRLNLHFLDGCGRAELDKQLAEGRFRIHVPEEAALLLVRWLIEHEELERAASLLGAIAPYFDRLRFYPVPHLHPRAETSGVWLRTVGDTVRSLRATRPKQAVDSQREAVRVWAPLYDRLVALYLETVEGECPDVARTPAGALARGPRGQLEVVGGWPCQRTSPEWIGRARVWLSDYESARVMHRFCRKHEKPKENFARLRGYLDKWANDPAGLVVGDVHAIRTILAAIVARRGLPHDAAWQAQRSSQERSVAKPTHVALAHALAERLTKFPRDDGLTTLDAVIAAVAPEGALPRPVAHKAMRCIEGPLPLLMQRGVLPSAEVMTDVLPALHTYSRSARIADPVLRRVFEATYQAFRITRSHASVQARDSSRAENEHTPEPQFGDLPWVQAISRWVGTDETVCEATRATLCQVVLLALDAHPQALMPSRLVRELGALSVAAGLHLPLVEMQGAGRFSGEFSETHLHSAQAAARLLGGSFYERYYGLPYARVLELNDVQRTRAGRSISAGFAEVCGELAGTHVWSRKLVRNGTVLEQSQILTTHNLAALFEALALARGLNLLLLARKTFAWICRYQRRAPAEQGVQLQRLKKTAYAWRQMIFYLALVPPVELAPFFDWMELHLARQRPQLRARIGPAIAPLRAIAAGECFDEAGQHAATGGRRLLGWSITPHWFLQQLSSTAVETHSLEGLSVFPSAARKH